MKIQSYKLYTYNFDGLALGGEMKIIAKNRDQADICAKARGKAYGKIKNLKFEKEESMKDLESDEGFVVYFTNGDY